MNTQPPQGHRPANGLIAKDSINQVLQRADIVTEIGERVQLKKAGSSFVGLCPFHGEKTPSFSVNPTHQRYHCFGCGAAGDVIAFLMAHDGMDFAEAVEDLSSKFGIKIEREAATTPNPNSAKKPTHTVYQTLTSVCESAQAQFQKNLAFDEAAKAYVAKRGLTAEVIEAFGVGFALPRTDGLRQAFPDYDSSPLLIAAGLVAKAASGPREGERFDRFRDRLTFPIRDTKGRVIGFGGRIIHNNNPKAAKYLNSPENELFSKHRVLYGLHEARASIMRNKQVFVAEGYMDVIAMAMHGIPNTVAAMGTALTQDHARLLLRFSKNICFVFDGDGAGQAAAWKSAHTVLPFLEPGVNFSFLTLPEQQDPDEFLQAHGKNAFLQRANKAQSLSTFVFDRLMQTHGQDGQLHSLEAKANFARDAMEMASAIPDANPVKQLMLAEIETQTGVHTGAIKRPAPSYGPTTTRNAQGPLEKKRAWLPPEEFKAKMQAMRHGAPTDYRSMPSHERLFRSPLHDRVNQPPQAPVITTQTLWERLAMAVRIAPQTADQLSRVILRLLDPKSQEEMDVMMAFDSLNTMDDFEPPAGTPEDVIQSAKDLLGNAVDLIAKQRKAQHKAHLKNLRTKGEISEEAYVAEVMRQS